MTTDPETRLVEIRKMLRDVDSIPSDYAEAMHVALSELLARHALDTHSTYCRHCGEAWPCETYDIISTALGDVKE